MMLWLEETAAKVVLHWWPISQRYQRHFTNLVSRSITKNQTCLGTQPAACLGLSFELRPRSSGVRICFDGRLCKVEQRTPLGEELQSAESGLHPGPCLLHRRLQRVRKAQVNQATTQADWSQGPGLQKMRQTIYHPPFVAQSAPRV